MSNEEFEDLFGNTPFENIEKIKKYINEKYIEKSKIKDKIEDLKENNNGDDYNLTNVIMILKELLGEGD